MLTIHDLRFIEEAGGIKRFLFWWLWLFLPCLRADRVTVISEFTKSRLLQLCRVNPAKIRVIPNCVSTAFTPAPKPWPTDRPQVLLVGTTDNKNLGRVVDACAGLDVRLVILGRPTEAQQTQLAQSGLEHESHHRLASEAVVALYQSCDLVCFVSTYEGFGMPILEGQAVGRPVLTSNISPMGEVAGEGALKVDPFDVVAIRAGLKRLLDEPDLREVLIEEGFRNVAKYSAKSVAAQYAELYREIVAQRV
jgi:glycosyltransferase involved in cell wall biosynthesis